MGKTKIKTIEIEEPKEADKLSVLGDQLSDNSQSVVSQSEAEEPKTDQPESENQKQKTDNRKKKPGKARLRSKKYQEAIKLVDRTQKYPLEEAVKLAQTVSYSKFPGTLEAHINTSAKNLRGLVSLPYLSGKSLRILAFGPSTGSTTFTTSSLRVNKDAPELEGVIWGNDETISDIEKGKINFDILVTTPEWMPKLAKVAKILGPRGLMPNPKNGTISENLEKTIAEFQGGKIEYKSEPNGQVIHLAIGKNSQATDEVTANIKTLYNTLGKSKVKKITLAPTMGPGVKVELKSI